MAVTEIVKALGDWSVKLAATTPQWVLDALDQNRFGHVAIDAARYDPTVAGDALLSSARYVGVLRGTSQKGDGWEVKGAGMAFWLADEDKKGAAIEAPGVSFTNALFTEAIRGLLPASGAVTEGTFYPVAGATYSGSHKYQSPREAIDYVCDLYECDWRVNGDATLDAGPEDDLFVTTPVAAVVRRQDVVDGADMRLRAIPGQAQLDRDVNDFTTRVVTIAEGNGNTVAVGSANILPEKNPYVDLHGNPVMLTRLVSESNTSLTNANARAQLQLNRFTSTRDALALTTTTHDIRGDVRVGDSVWIYDPDGGMVDFSNEVMFRGERIWPVRLRTMQLSWPVTQGMGVYLRCGDGTWIDLTDFVVFESGQATITVGGYNRSLTNQNGESIASRNLSADTSVPAAPAFVEPFTTDVESSPITGLSSAYLRVAWLRPMNTDGTGIIDGDHYEIDYRPTGTPDAAGWTTYVAAFDSLSAKVSGLVPGQQYDLRIRAVDSAAPANIGPWSAVTTAVTAGDDIPPSVPAPPFVAANLLSVQVKHTLGRASGGTYNLESDLAGLKVHVSGSDADFTPDDDVTLVGRLLATGGTIASQVPAIGSFTIPETAQVWVKVVAYDQSGNESLPSEAATSSATLLDSTYITELTASKIGAGDLSAAVALVGSIATAPTGARWMADATGSKTYRPSGTLALHEEASTGDFVTYAPNGTTRTFRIEASTGNVYLYQSDGVTAAMQLTASTGVLSMVGRMATGASGRFIALDPAATFPAAGTFPTLVFAQGTNGPARINSVQSGSDTVLGLNSGPSTTGSTYNMTTMFMFPDRASLQYNDQDNQVRGGRLFASSTNASIEAYNSSGTNVAYMDVRTDGGVDLFATGACTFGNGSGFIAVTSGGTLTIVSNGTSYTPKSFIIDNPLDPSRWLIHACTESPVSGVEYNERATVQGGRAVVELPRYFDALTEAEGRVITLTPYAYTDPTTGQLRIPSAAPTEIVDGRFVIVSDAPDGTPVGWRVFATRKNAAFPVEPRRSDITVRGDGPYRYIAA